MIGGLIGASAVRVSTYVRPTSLSTNAPASTDCGREVCGPPPPLVVVQATPSPQPAAPVVLATPYIPPPAAPVTVTATPSPPPPPAAPVTVTATPSPPPPPLTRSYTRGGGGGTVTASAPPPTFEAPVADIVPSSPTCPTGLSWPGVAATAAGGFVLGLILGIVSGRMPKSKRRR